MNMPPINISVTSQKNCLIIKSKTRSLDSSNAGVFYTEVVDSLNQTDCLVVLLNNFDFIDSTGLGIIISLNKAALKLGKTIRFTNPSENVQDAIKLLKLGDVIKLYKDLEEALL